MSTLCHTFERCWSDDTAHLSPLRNFIRDCRDDEHPLPFVPSRRPGPRIGRPGRSTASSEDSSPVTGNAGRPLRPCTRLWPRPDVRSDTDPRGAGLGAGVDVWRVRLNRRARGDRGSAHPRAKSDLDRQGLRGATHPRHGAARPKVNRLAIERDARANRAYVMPTSCIRSCLRQYLRRHHLDQGVCSSGWTIGIDEPQRAYAAAQRMHAGGALNSEETR